MRKGWELSARRIGILVAVPVILYVGYTVASRALEFSALQGEASRLRAEIQALQERAQQLEQRKEEVQQEQHIEWIAREELGLAKKGETALVIVAQPPSPTPPGGATSPQGLALPNWRLWWQWLFGPPSP